jgi:GcrA cell cycle regulator
MSWSDERVEILKRMWLDGKSASEIAKELGEITRNAVIGKVHRLGLSNRGTNSIKTETVNNQETAKRKRGRPPKDPSVNKQIKTPKRGIESKINLSAASSEGSFSKNNSIIEEVDVNRKNNLEVVSDLSEETIKNLLNIERKSKKISLMDLTERTCKWPIGDPATENFWFCGHDSEAGKPYCKTHISIAFQPVSQRRAKKEG